MNTPSHTAWFALNTRLRYEDFVARQVRGKGYETFLPVYKRRRRWSDRMKELELPLFPGYLFCRFNPSDRLPILSTPGVLQIVGRGKNPVPVQEEEIVAIQTAVGSGLPSEPWPFLHIGQRIRVATGPLVGIEGILLEFKGGHRLVLSVSLLQRSVAVEVDGTWVTSISEESSSSRSSVQPAA